MLSGVVILAAVQALLGTAELTPLAAHRMRLIAAQMDATAAALAVLLAAVCVVRWRLGGENGLVWLGAGAALYGGVTVFVGDVVFASMPDLEGQWLCLPAAARMVTAVLLLRAIWPPRDGVAQRPWLILLGAGGATALLTLLLHLTPGGGATMVGAIDGALNGGVQPQPTSAAFTLVWAGLAIAAMTRGLRSGRTILAWSGLLLFTMAFGELVRFDSTVPNLGLLVGPSLLLVLGVLAMLGGATGELIRTYLIRGNTVLELVVAEREAEVRREAELAAQSEREHEARNALTAIEGATRTLQRYQDQLDSQTRSDLADGVAAEIRRLQRILSAQSQPSEVRRFGLRDALEAVVVCARSDEAPILMDVADDLEAIGQPEETAEVLQNLIDNARHYAGGEITVRAEPVGSRVAIHVEDRGPGIRPQDRTVIFERGERRAEGIDGSGLGLYIGRQLMTQQNGDLRVTDRPGGGARFTLTLPTPALELTR